VARVVIEQLSKSFPGSQGEPIRAVNDLGLAIEDGELLVLAGPSGSGKTTLLRLLAGLDRPDQGTITLDGAVTNDVPPEGREVAMVFQNAALYPHMTVYENLAFGLSIRKVARPEIRKRVEEAAAVLELTACLDRFPMKISGGERQRVALGRALVRKPRIFLLDEPLSNLDAPTRLQLRRQIAAVHRQLGATTVYVTHEQAEAMALGDRIALLREGRLEQVGPPAEIYQEPANLFVARFFGSPPINLIAGTLAHRRDMLWFEAEPRSEDRLAFSFEECMGLDHALGRSLTLGIRPEETRIFSESPGSSKAARNATVEQVEYLGGDLWVHLAVAGYQLLARAPAREHLKPDARVWLQIVARRALIFDSVTGASLFKR
jgi:multiple sugar transport system ATP-binding protein